MAIRRRKQSYFLEDAALAFAVVLVVLIVVSF